MKKALIIVAVIVVLIVAGIFFLISRLDSLFAQAIEYHGSKATQTTVSVSGVDLSLREGTGSIKGFTIANPEGFSEGNAFSLEDITLALDIQSMQSDVLVIDLIRIAAPVVSAEFAGDGSTNIDAIRKKIEEASGGSSEGEEGAPAPEKRILIREFVFERGRIELDATALGMEEKAIDLPEIVLTDIGGEDGALPGEIAEAVLAAFSKKVAEEVARSGISDQLKEKVGDGLEDKAKGLLDKVGG